MLGVIKGVEKLQWELNFLDNVLPEAVKAALEVVDKLTVDSVFSTDTTTLVEFLDNICGELPYRSDPIVRIISNQIRLLSNEIQNEVKTTSDFDMITKSWSATRDNETLLFQPVDAQKLSIFVAGTETIAERLTTNGPWKKFDFDNETLKRLEELKEKTPNFTEVIDCVMDAVTLAVRYNRPIRITPILMVGEPGIGKSFFTNQLSPTLCVPLTRIAVDNLQIGADLAGQSHAYTKSSPGAVFRVLTEEDHISPVVILDELDKVPSNWGYGDPLGPLHNLLEPVSAKVFKDASFPIPIDASHVIWIATANSLASIPQTIKSRFEVYKVSPPSADCFDAILKEICQELESEYPGVSINNNVTKVLSGKTPREQRQLLQRAVARAIRLGDDTVNDLHLREVMGRSETRARLDVGRWSKGYL